LHLAAGRGARLAVLCKFAPKGSTKINIGDPDRGFGAMANGGLRVLPKLLGVHAPVTPYRALMFAPLVYLPRYRFWPGSGRHRYTAHACEARQMSC